jgi:hypothetical protein
LPSLAIAQLYKHGWQVELFFKWLIQCLRIKAFYGTTINAVKTRTWIAICVYVLVSIIMKEMKIERSLGEILQIMIISLLEKIPILRVVSHEFITTRNSATRNQLSLFDIKPNSIGYKCK